MRHILFSIVLLFLTLTVSAQPENWYISLSMGGCLPVGSFADTNPASAENGFALKGFALNLDATYPLSAHWGIKGMVMLTSNPVDRNGMGTLMENRMKKQVSFTEPERTNLAFSVNSWMSNSMIIGPVYSLNFNKVAWDFQLMAGMHVAYLPNQNLLLSNPDNEWEYMQRNTNPVNISLDLLAGTALRFPVTEKIQLKVAVDYQKSRIKNSYEELRMNFLGTSYSVDHLGNGSNIVPKDVVIGTVGFVFYL
ncbi:MAG TPA: hypothetical protein VIK10_03920 [Prolixibacteraceae bacterium]